MNTADASVPMDPQDDLLGEIQDYYKEAISTFDARRYWFDKNLLMYRGLQFGFQSALPSWAMLSLEDEQELREVYNYVQATVRSAVASRLQSLIAPGSAPAKPGVRARARAKASHRLMRSFLRGEVFDYEELVRATIGASILGASYLKTFWDTSVGPFMQYPDGSVGREGDARVKHFDVYDVLPDPYARTASEISRVFHRKLVPVKVAESRWKTDIFGAPTKGRFARRGEHFTAWNRSRSIQDDGALDNQTSNSSRSDRYVEIVEMWERECEDYPGGRFVAFSGAMIIAASALPHRWPWRMLLGDNILPGGLYPDGTVRPLVPLQQTLNKIESKIAEWFLKLANPKWLAAKGSGIDENQLLDDSIALVTYNPNIGARPEIVQSPMPPSEMFAQSVRLVNGINDISGYSGLTQGNVPTNVDSARGMMFLTERESGGRAPDRYLYQRTIAGALKDALELYRDFAPEDRMVAIFGLNGKDALLTPFRRRDYDFDTEIIVDVNNPMPDSPATRAANAFEIANAGGFEDTLAAKRFRAYVSMDHDQIDGQPDPDILHRERNLMEQNALLDGQLERIFVLPQDNDDIHLEQDDEFMITAEFLEADPLVQAFYRQHHAMHEAQRNQKLSLFSQEQRMMAGGSDAGEVEAGKNAPQPNAQEDDQESPQDGGWGGPASGE